jgi:hypothetical protein
MYDNNGVVDQIQIYVGGGGVNIGCVYTAYINGVWVYGFGPYDNTNGVAFAGYIANAEI